MIILDKWYGRLGNNICQLFHIIDIALFYNHNVCFNVEHKFFDLKIIEEYFNQYKNDIILKCPQGFFFNRKFTEIYNDKEKYIKNSIIKKDLLKKSFLVKDINKLDENDIVVHIRSGDIFNKNPHYNYVPPPLSYYVKELNKKEYNKIIIVCEDKINPVVDKLLELYKNSVYTQNTLEEDIKIVLGATNILSSVGTFVKSLIILSNNIKYHYGHDCNNPELKDYYLFMKPWKNTPEQRDYILNYEFK